MKILITGANGFIGRYLCDALKAEHDVTGIGYGDSDIEGIKYINTDITNYEKLESIFKGTSFDIVYHFAAVTFHDDIVNKKTNTLYISLKGTENVVTLFNKYCNNAIFLYTSTGKVYGGGDTQPISEANFPKPTNALGKSKYMTERLIDYYSEGNKSNKFVIFRMFNIYGYGQRDSFVIPHIIKHLKANKPLPLGNLKDYRDYLYIDDLIECFVEIANGKMAKQKDILSIYNIGSGKPYCVQDILDIVEKKLGRKLNIQISESRQRKDETETEYSDSRKIESITGWKAKTSLEDGISKMLQKEGLIK